MMVEQVTTAIAFRAGRIDGGLQAEGIRVALGDLLIGATALELGYSVLTSNVRHFERTIVERRPYRDAQHLALKS